MIWNITNNGTDNIVYNITENAIYNRIEILIEKGHRFIEKTV